MAGRRPSGSDGAGVGRPPPHAPGLAELAAEASTWAEEWRRINGQQNYAENLKLALALAAAATQEKVRADQLEKLLSELTQGDA